VVVVVVVVDVDVVVVDVDVVVVVDGGMVGTHAAIPMAAVATTTPVSERRARRFINPPGGVTLTHDASLRGT